MTWTLLGNVKSLCKNFYIFYILILSWRGFFIQIILRRRLFNFLILIIICIIILDIFFLILMNLLNFFWLLINLFYLLITYLLYYYINFLNYYSLWIDCFRVFFKFFFFLRICLFTLNYSRLLLEIWVIFLITLTAF